MKLWNFVNDLEQYSREACLEFQGIPYTNDKSDDKLITNLAQKLVSHKF